jgi:hypothetical protein
MRKLRSERSEKKNECKNFLIKMKTIQSDHKENKSEQALQITGHVVADSVQISVQRLGVDIL